jgi:hypothetical protein
MRRAASILALTFLAVGCSAGGTAVVVRNAGDAPLDSVWVFATGDSAFLGTIAARAEAGARLRPRGESHLELTHRGHDGRILIDSYLEPGTRGPIVVEIDGERARIVP